MRHGQTEFNIKHLAQGGSDSPLTKLGVQQIINARYIINEFQFDHVYSSDLNRAIDTAKIVTNNQYEIKLDSRLRETNFGKFEAKPNHKKNLHILLHPISEYRNVNGEKMIDSIHRYDEFIQEKYKEDLEKLINVLPNAYIQVLTNASVYSDVIQNAIKNGEIEVIPALDFNMFMEMKNSKKYSKAWVRFKAVNELLNKFCLTYDDVDTFVANIYRKNS